MRISLSRLQKIRRALHANHGGPGPHKSGSSQDVHGSGGDAEYYSDQWLSRWKKESPEDLQAFVGKRYRVARDRVDGREVINRDDVPNLDSIGASLYEYEILDGVREVSMADFNTDSPSFYSTAERERVEELAGEIKRRKQITPLIVVADPKGPYILEGGHRFDALTLLKAKSFPAVVVVDYDQGLYQ